MKWYDIFANFYDNSLEKLYFSSRKRAIEILELKPHQNILDIACGTGANFIHIKNAQPSVKIFGTDFSEGMLRKCKNNIYKNNWNDVFIFQEDAQLLSPVIIEKHLGTQTKFDNIICVLGLSVIPNWELALNNMLDLLQENGKIVIVDVYAEKRDFNTWMVEKIAKADLDRKIWQTLENKSSNFKLEYLPIKESKIGGRLFIAIGTKKAINPSNF